MIALSVIAVLITILAGTFAVIGREMSLAHRRAYREEAVLNDFACAVAPELSAPKRKMKAKPRPGPKRRQPAANRPAAGRANSALLLR